MIRVFFGSPGSGKTTLACRMFFKLQKQDRRLQRRKKLPNYDYYFSNFDNDLSKKCNLSGLGSWSFPDHSYIIIDEAGIEYNSRKYKDLPQSTIAWFKLHRHYRCDVDFISQSWEDMDITVRRLADELWYIKKLGPLSLIRRVYKSVEIDENSHQIIDSYRFGKIIKRLLPFPFHQKTWFLIWRPKYYKYFNTHERIKLPVQYFGYPPPQTSAHAEYVIPYRQSPETVAKESPGDVPTSDRSCHVGAGSPGALARRRIASMPKHILTYMQRLKNKIISRTK